METTEHMKVLMSKIIKGDITEKDSLVPIFKDVEIVFHTAALINLDRRFRDQIRLVNVLVRKMYVKHR